jgi:glycosyltransferase involved in cell wall biosynthesis
MTTKPRLSIGLPVHNGEAYLSESLDALLAQSYQDFELIISDNASTDGTEEICRRYAAHDPRIRYLRQPANIGAAPNHNAVLEAARGELFKWASHDDLYDRDLLARCVEVLDTHPDVVLVSSYSAVIEADGGRRDVAVNYPRHTDSTRAAERFRAQLFALGGDDDYGVIRTEVLRTIAPTGSHYHADRTLVAELTLHGRFHRVPEALYFRRDLPTRAGRQHQGVRSWCVTHDPRRANRLRHPTVRLLAEYVWAFVDAIHRAPLSARDKRECYRELSVYLASRALPGLARRHADETTQVVVPPRAGVASTGEG